MSGNIGVKLDRMNVLLAQILERLPERQVNGAEDWTPGVPVSTAVSLVEDFTVESAPKKRGWPKGKPRGKSNG